MKSFQVGFSVPTISKRVPTSELWTHEVKHDGYRLMARKQGERVKLYTRNGHDWASR